MADLSSSVSNIQSQKELIHSHISRAMAKGETWYLVESKWFKAFKHYVGMDDMWDGIGVTDDYPGPIDNTPLFTDDGTYTLKDSLIDELDYVLVPSEAWELLVQWYGTVDEKTAIPRQVIEYGVFVKHCKVEVYLLEVRLCKNWKTDEAVSHKFSKGDKVEHIEKTMRKIFDIKDNEATHLWSGYSGNVYDELNKLESTVQDAGLYQNQLIVIETADYDGTHSRPCRKPASTLVSSTQTSATADRTTAGTSGGGIIWTEEILNQLDVETASPSTDQEELNAPRNSAIQSSFNSPTPEGQPSSSCITLTPVSARILQQVYQGSSKNSSNFFVTLNPAPIQVFQVLDENSSPLLPSEVSPTNLAFIVPAPVEFYLQIKERCSESEHSSSSVNLTAVNTQICQQIYEVSSASQPSSNSLTLFCVPAEICHQIYHISPPNDPSTSLGNQTPIPAKISQPIFEYYCPNQYCTKFCTLTHIYVDLCQIHIEGFPLNEHSTQLVIITPVPEKIVQKLSSVPSPPKNQPTTSFTTLLPIATELGLQLNGCSRVPAAPQEASPMPSASSATIPASVTPPRKRRKRSRLEVTHIPRQHSEDITNSSGCHESLTTRSDILPPSGEGCTNCGRSTRYNQYSYPSESRAAPGLCGLCNLGNTCFMNSVLQCMSNCPPITKYFLNDEHLPELNEENPLGMKGEIAKAFGELIKIMWSGKHSYTMPHQFKLQVGRFAPQFLGYQQHDSQELLTFLLDGLHEDLNRIKKKPYIELQDSPGRPDKDVAKEAWENYRKRNDSIIVDFFHGLLKSTVVCPDCSKVSITFDPFCYLSLPLPTKKERALEVLLFHYNPELKPTHYTVIVPKRGFIKDLVSNIGRLSGIPADHLIVTEVSRSHFHKFFASNDPIEKIEDKDMIYIYEMPLDSNTHVIMPVYLWESTGKQAFNQDQLFGNPILVAAPRKDCTYDLLYQLVIHKLSRYLKVPDDNSSWWFPKTQKITNGELAPTDDDTTDENDKVMCSDCERRRLFTFYLMTTTQNGTDAVKLHNDGNPLELPNYMGQNFIALRWSQEARERFFYEKTMEDTEDDQSTKNNLQALKLRDCIELYTTREKLGADDAWYCPSCKKHQQATKKFDLWSLPRILIIHLKRFVYNRLRRDKVDRTVHYPIRGLNMSEYVINEEHPDAVYDLIGVCNHYGGLGGGHYTACCQNINDKKWYLFDDNTVTEMKEQNVISNAAYVLFYMRRDPDDGQTHMELN